MGVTSYKGRARRALLHKTNSTYWCAIGRTTVWTDEENPPAADPTATDIDEAICFVKPSLISLCKIVQSGEDFTHLGTKYAYVSDQNALTENARFLYLVSRFDPSAGQPYDDYRQVAIFSDLVPDQGHELDSWLAPADVTDPGLLEYIDNDTVVTMASDRLGVIEIMIEFR
jgi:hypothetical protein